MSDSKLITVETTVNAPLETVWEYWVNPEHVTQWNAASDDWHTPTAENDLREGGAFKYHMAAKDESVGFDFSGTYTRVAKHKIIEFTMDDERKVRIQFEEQLGATHITETFETETENSMEMQKQGWQAILDNFKTYVESSS